MRGGTTAEKEHGQRGHYEQVISDGHRGESRRDDQGNSKAKRLGWSGRSEGGSAEEMEEDGMTEEDPGGSVDTLTASP